MAHAESMNSHESEKRAVGQEVCTCLQAGLHCFMTKAGCPRSGKKSGKKIFFQGQGIVREF